MAKNWQRVPAPNTVGSKVHGWVREMNEAYRDNNGEYAVLVRLIETRELGVVKHAAIRNATSTDIPWSEKRLILREVKKLLKNDENIVLVSDTIIKTSGNTIQNINNLEGATSLLRKIKEDLR